MGTSVLARIIQAMRRLGFSQAYCDRYFGTGYFGSERGIKHVVTVVETVVLVPFAYACHINIIFKHQEMFFR